MTPDQARELPRDKWFTLDVPSDSGTTMTVSAKVLQQTPSWWPFAWPLLVCKPLHTRFRIYYWLSDPVSGRQMTEPHSRIDHLVESLRARLLRAGQRRLLDVICIDSSWAVCQVNKDA